MHRYARAPSPTAAAPARTGGRRSAGLPAARAACGELLQLAVHEVGLLNEDPNAEMAFSWLIGHEKHNCAVWLNGDIHGRWLNSAMHCSSEDVRGNLPAEDCWSCVECSAMSLGLPDIRHAPGQPRAQAPRQLDAPAPRTDTPSTRRSCSCLIASHCSTQKPLLEYAASGRASASSGPACSNGPPCRGADSTACESLRRDGVLQLHRTT